MAFYGWEDIDSGLWFGQNERGQTRYTITPEHVGRYCVGCWALTW